MQASLLVVALTIAPQVEPAPPGHTKMIRELDAIAVYADEENTYVGTGTLRKLEAILDKLPASAPAVQRCDLEYQVGKALLRLGEEARSIEHLEKAVRLLPKARAQLPKGGDALITLSLGIAWLRRAETENCCQRHHPDSCVFPIRGGGVHTRPESSKRAIEVLGKALALAPPDTRVQWKARWLLNVAHMTVGTWPDGVPEAHRIPAKALESDEPFPRFHNIAKKVGLDTFSLLGGAVVDDFNGDGHLDVMVSSWDPNVSLRVFHADGKGGFTDVTKRAGVTGIRGGINLVQADYDNDGDVDVLVLRGGWFSAAGRHPNSLLANRGDGTFVDVTFDAGLADVRLPTQTASWADYDLDGDLDLFVGNESSKQVPAPSNLFRNNGDGTFTDVAEAAGVTNDRFTKAVVFGDYDGDRYPDLYVSNYKQQNRLYRNKGDGTFEDVAARRRVAKPIESFPTWFFDYNNDGHIDLFVASYAGGIAELCEAYIRKPARRIRPALYRSNRRGGFFDAAPMANFRRPSLPMGCNFGDLDGDGFLDFYLGTGWPETEELMPNVMYRNRAGRSFADITVAGGFGNLQKGHAVAFADLDNDGDLDVFQQMGGAYKGDRYYDSLYENPGFGHRWISLRLEGKQSNRSAIGAHITVTVAGERGSRAIHRRVNSGGSFGANPLRQTIGLGKTDAIESLEVYWPTTDQRQVFDAVPLDTHLRLVEGAKALEVRKLTRTKLGR